MALRQKSRLLSENPLSIHTTEEGKNEYRHFKNISKKKLQIKFNNNKENVYSNSKNNKLLKYRFLPLLKFESIQSTSQMRLV